MLRMRSLLFFCLLSAPSVFAQTYTAAKVHFSDPGAFTQQQLEDAAGVHAGTSLTAAQLGEAAQRLVNTGFFEDVGATVNGKVSAATILFTDKAIPTTQMLPVAFENLVWLTQDEIEAAIHARFPLFIGYLPENSPHQEEIKAALIAALAAKSVNADVAFDEFEPTLSHPRREIVFSITRPAIRIVNIHLGGVTPALAPLVQKSVNATSRTPYLLGPADVTTADSILAPLLDAGYAQATLTKVSTTQSTAADGSVALVLSATLSAGQVFHVSTLTYAGTPIFSAEAFQASAQLHPGDLASRKALIQTLYPIDHAYRNKGYMDVVVDAHPAPDATTSLIAYNVTVEPGAQYRLHEVTVNNLDPAAKADFDRGFLLKPGDLYNPSYISTFLEKNTALRALQGYHAIFKSYADPQAHTVDVVINFARSGR